MAVPRGSSRVVAAREQISCDLAREAVILHLGTGTYYGLDEVGARIWSLIQTPTTVDEVRRAIETEYEVEPERCERDLIAMFERLAKEGLVEVSEPGG
ncbi:MAG: PqqD family protein [Planctomycetes bacterium]|nr:PqqD family protein [Planctomycetota bacterium]